MASLESSSKICALCTKSTSFSIHSILGGEEEDDGGELLQKFNSEFNLLPKHTPTDNWSLCQNCMPNVQSAVQSKEKVDKVECQVRKLQLELLRQLENLAKEVNQMQGHLKKIQQTVLVPSKSTDSDITLKLFQQKIITVVGDLQTWQASTSEKLVQNLDHLKNEEHPLIKEEPESADHPANYLDNLEPGQHWLFFHDDNPDPTSNFPNAPEKTPTTATIEEPPQKIRRSAATKKKYFEQNDSSSSSLEDPDFDPSDLTMSKPLAYDKYPPKLLKNLSPFRRSLISRIRSRNTISTSKIIPRHDKSDPRRPFAIKYFPDKGAKRNRFFLDDHEILCLDEEKALQCATCGYKFNLSQLRVDSWKHTIEDNLFEHILSKHLKLYTCSVCGLGFDKYPVLRGHRLTHLDKRERAKFCCEICGKPMIREKSLRQHKWTHLSEEEKKEEGNRWMMPYHLKPTMVMGMRFQCATCGLEAKTEGNLRIHERTHLGMEEREEEMVICSECGVKMLRTNLKRHRRRRHGGDKGERKRGKN